MSSGSGPIPPSLRTIIKRYLLNFARNDHAYLESVTAESVRPRRGRGQVPLPSHYATYRREVRNEEIFRIDLDDDERLEVWRLQTVEKNQETPPAEFNARVWDHGEGLQLTSTIHDPNNRVKAGLDPLGVSSRGTTCSVDLTNTTGREVIGTVVGVMTVIDAELAERDLEEPG